ncbi:hypothetical protein [Pseudomonas sp. TTU2014-080ASC]|uniref:hypothetical protein n=1 Tax=Pseudomonas sp. TTU2014-080ASC TaxID=1729724 RepID=UPI0007184AC3|nr:hypothetical protein [Pseudomonas sp. TTU2014-080ASC]KRW57440.1 hypothetical protein AO726_19640 [Pseudomonas sp. TTU2014-080ASC]
MLTNVPVSIAALLSGLCRLIIGWVAVFGLLLMVLSELSDLNLIETAYKQSLRADAYARQTPPIAPGNPWASMW